MDTPGIVKGIAVRDTSRAPMKEQQQVEVTLQQGIVQDYRGTGLRQVTFLDAGQWQEVLDELGVDCHGIHAAPTCSSRASTSRPL